MDYGKNTDYRNDNNGGGTSKILVGALILLMAAIIMLMVLILYNMTSGKDHSSQTQTNQNATTASTAAATTQAPTTQATTTAAQPNTQQAATESKPANTATNNYYIIEGSDSRYVGTNDLAGLSSWELKCARNEIYARHGRTFNNSNLQNYFNSQAWYSGTVSSSSFSEDVLNKYEKANISFIKQYENGSVAATNNANNYYILPYSDSSYVSYSDLDQLSKQDLKYARNEIYARHGRRFDSNDLQDYFDSQAWYSGTISPSSFSESVLNQYEKANISTIKEYENSHY